jgi:hypothetical protein
MVARWEGGTVEPQFRYTRRIAVAAPWPLQLQFLGKSEESLPMSGADRRLRAEGETGGSSVDPELEAAITLVTAELRSISDPTQRRDALTEAMSAIRKVRQNPPQQVAENRPDRALPKSSSGRGSNRGT